MSYLHGKLTAIHDELLLLKSLKPSVKTNKLFTDLVNLAKEQSVDLVTGFNQLKSLNNLCSKGEFELENFWAKEIINDGYPYQKLESFPYYSNYLQLCNLEWNLITSCSKHIKHSILFIGGGPLPLTAIILAKIFGQQVTIIDQNIEAVNIAKTLLKALKIENVISVVHSDAYSFSGYKEFNLIYLAALVGLSSEEKRLLAIYIFNQVEVDTHVLMRGSWGNRRLLYPEFELNQVPLFNPVVELHPHNDVINSVYIFKK